MGIWLPYEKHVGHIAKPGHCFLGLLVLLGPSIDSSMIVFDDFSHSSEILGIVITYLKKFAGFGFGRPI